MKKLLHRRFSLPLLVLAVCRCVASQSPAAVDLSEGWKFHKGDNSAWSKSDIDISKWQKIQVGKSWESQGHGGYDGYAWYRKHLTIAASLKKSQAYQQNKMLKLTLGKIDDVDQTWFNGQLIGGTGNMPDAYNSAWSVSREYLVPGDLIHWGGDNVVAVRVYDGVNDGGMVAGPYRLQVVGAADLLECKFDLGRGDGIFVDEGGLPIRVNLNNQAKNKVAGKLVWTIENDESEKLFGLTDAVDIPAGENRSVRCKRSPQEPGFYRVKVSVRTSDGSVSKPQSILLGYQPEKIQSPLTAESDFDAFWKATLEELASIKPDFKMTRQDNRDTETHELYLVEMRSLNNVRVRGWYQKPKAAGEHPALLRVPGYTQNMQPMKLTDSVAVFSFNIRGHGNSQDDVKGTPVDYWVRGLDDKSGYFYEGAYADCVRAVDFLASRDEIDKKRIAVTGGSQGGGLSLATAGLDSRISLCVPDIPFLCDWVKYFKASHWPEMDRWIAEKPERTWSTTLRTMGYFDSLNFASRIKCPVFMGAGLQDETCPAGSIFSVYNRLKVPKQYFVYPKAGHWVGPEHAGRKMDWLRNQWKLAEK